MHLSKNKVLSAAAICRAGFTLIEVMVVVAIISILAAVAYPSYQESIRKGKRAEGRAALMQLMQQQEQYYSQHNSYIKFSSASVDVDEMRFKWFSGNSATKSAYEISGEVCPPPNDTIQNCVRLVAVPGTSNVDSGYKDPVPGCGTFVLTSIGEKSADGTDCWK
jgi:type IV pilus assembly protein PilE